MIWTSKKWWFRPPKKSNVEISKNSSKCSTAMGKLKYWEFVDFTKFLAQFLDERAVRAHRADIPTFFLEPKSNPHFFALRNSIGRFGVLFLDLFLTLFFELFWSKFPLFYRPHVIARCWWLNYLDLMSPFVDEILLFRLRISWISSAARHLLAGCSLVLD